MKQLTLKDVTITIDATQEDIPIRGNFFATGDEKRDKRAEDRVIKALESTVWAWCKATVTVSYMGLQSSENCSCCNYKSQDDFLRGDTYKDMVKDCLRKLQLKVNNLVSSVMAD